MRPFRSRFRGVRGSRRGLGAWVLAGFGAAAGGPWAPAGENCHYTWVQIPNPPGWSAYPRAINSLGHVAGNLANGGDFTRAFVWTPELGVRQIPRPPGVLGMSVQDINEHDFVVGSVERHSGQFAYVWDGSQVTEIATVAGSTLAVATSINNAGQVVGYYDHPTLRRLHGFLWENGVFTDLGMGIEQGNQADDINERGQVYGTAIYPGGPLHACRFVDGAVQFLQEPEGSAQSFVGEATNNGAIAGFVSDAEHEADGVIWTDDGVQVIETSGQFAYLGLFAANDSIRAIGDGRPTFHGRSTWIVWQDGNLAVIRDLLDPPAYLTGVMDINRAGQIAAVFSYSDTESGAVVLNPVWQPADLTGDCHVSLPDLVLVLSNFGLRAESYPRGDVNLDGAVDLVDLAILLTHWGE